MRSQPLRGSHLALVDRNAQTLDWVGRLAQRLNANGTHKCDFHAYAPRTGPGRSGLCGVVDRGFAARGLVADGLRDSA